MAKKKLKDFDYKTIKTFEDACKKENVNPKDLPIVDHLLPEFRKPTIAVYKLFIIFKAINNGWEADYTNGNQYKYFPWSIVLSSGVGFDYSYYDFGAAATSVGVRLCTNTPEKALYIAEQFKEIRADYLLYTDVWEYSKPKKFKMK